jgi:predicted RNA-binding Zn ribbon-like protein
MNDHLAVRFANTRYAERGEPRDALAGTRELRDWLSHQDLPAHVSTRDVAVFQGLREATRRLLDALAAGVPLPSADVAEVNSAAAAAPFWPELIRSRTDGGGVRLVQRSTADAPAVALARLAGSVAELVTGDRRERVRACGAPGCVLFFEQSRERRTWCSAGCGNRARVARHYERARHGA